jgi:pseudaminic acid synthase
MKPLSIHTPHGPRVIGPGQPVFVIAEMSGNHNQDIGRAKQLIDAAVAAQVDAIKLQTYTPDSLTIDCDNEHFQVKVNADWRGATLYQLYQRAYTPWEWQAELKAYAEARGVLLFSSAFDEASVDFLEQLGVELYKVASFEIGDIPLLQRIGRTRKPVIVSRGLASTEDIALAVRTLSSAGTEQLAMLHCVSSYPARPEQMNLLTIPDLAARFDLVGGLSDHTLGTTVAVAAVALGASIVEKHFTLRRSEGGPDAAFSLEPAELAELVRAIRETSASLGRVSYEPDAREAENLVFRRSLFVVQDIAAGERFTTHNVRIIRPGYGLAPRHLPQVLGQCARRALQRGTPLTADAIEGGLP